MYVYFVLSLFYNFLFFFFFLGNFTSFFINRSEGFLFEWGGFFLRLPSDSFFASAVAFP